MTPPPPADDRSRPGPRAELRAVTSAPEEIGEAAEGSLQPFLPYAELLG